MANRSSRRARKRKAAVETRRQKEFTYRGLTLEQLQELSMEEVLPLLPSRARRTFQRGLDDQGRKLLENVRNSDDGQVIRTHCRGMPVLPEFVGRTFAVHNGREFEEVEIQPEMIGHYLGEFAQTRKSVRHTGPGVGATRSSKFMPLK